jgi:hypothetical protein
VCELGKYYSKTPYNYVLGNPLIFIDPDGREVDVSKALKSQEGFYALVNTMLDLSEITGMALSVQNGKLKESDETLGLGQGDLGGSSSARDFVRHLVNDEKNNIEFKEGTLPDKTFGDTDSDHNGFTVDAKQNDDNVNSLKKGGINSLAFGFGFTFLHEATHTSSGANYFKSNDHFEHIPGVGGESMYLSRIEKKLNVFRQELGLPEIKSTAATAWNEINKRLSTTWIVNGTEKVILMQKTSESAEARSTRVNNFNQQHLTLWTIPK